MKVTNCFYLFFISHEKIKRTSQFTRVREIDIKEHNNSKYINLDFYIKEKKVDETLIIIHFKREMHIVDDFKTDLLIDINVIKLKVIIADFNNKNVIIKNCGVIVSLIVTFKKKRVDRIIRIIVLTTILLFTTMSILVKFQKRFILINKNYNFYFILNA